MSVTVLTPNGRRQNVKITPNTTLLQVLEEVCAKHGFKPEEYDIRHHNKILDVSSIFRFSGLPNNAQLEMIEATKQRSESPVVLGLHLESGDRVTGEFVPSESLWNVILTLSPEAKSLPSPVVIYMRKEVCGKENLEKTTLRSLGLTGGRAVLRFFNRTPEELHTQANVSEVLSRTKLANKTNTERESSVLASKELQQPHENKSPKLSDRMNSKDVKEQKIQQSESSCQFEQNPIVEPVNKFEVANERKVEHGKMNEKPKTEVATKQVAMNTVTMNKESKFDTCSSSDIKSKVVLLGDRNAVAYNLNTVKPSESEEMPDDFYELTVSDAKLLLRDAKQLCADMENAPLMTSAQRELEQNKKILSLLNQYKKTVLRIKFPDRTVLQGTFSSVEKIAAVERFVADYLQNPNVSFYLYTTPPKEILKSDRNLLECNCVPCAILYFGVRSEGNESNQFLRSDVLDKFSTPSAAVLTALQSRGLVTAQIKEEEICDGVINGPGPSTSNTSQINQTREQEKSPPFKVPKWFKMQK